MSILPKEFGKSKWAKQTASVINLYAFKMSSKSYAQYRFNGISELGFKPLKFIKTLIELYVNLSEVAPLVEEIVADERSYSRDTLIDIGSTSYKKNLLSENILDKFENLINELEIIEDEQKKMKEIIGDNYPDEFTCGLTYDLMKDPVKLRTSDIIVDRKAIEKQMTISGEFDPYNRKTMTKADLIPQTELKAKIKAWMNDKMKIYYQKYGKSKKKQINRLKNSNNDVYEAEDDNDDDNAFYKPLM